jgi:predicted site-specific integrase-resolvase
LLGDPGVTWVVVGHRARFARFGVEYVAALLMPGRRLLVVGPCEVDDEAGRDVTQILTSLCARLCARLYGRRAAGSRAARAVAAIEQKVP